ncbi:MAG: VWA domain-containing protein [Planctomycetes bacterium]|nr:VWA domain-containing protein [Planctomycetota bacterium]
MSFLSDLPTLSLPVALAAGAVLSLFGMFAVLLVSGRWSFRLASISGVLLLGSLGSLIAADVRDSLRTFVRSVQGLEIVRPWWLLLLAVVPFIAIVARKNLRALGRFRKWFAVSLRSLVVVSLVFALAEPRVRQTTEHATVIFVIDRSLSVPPDSDPNRRGPDGDPIDRRWERIKKFVDESVRYRGPDHRSDRAGVILFGRTPRLVLPPAAVDQLPIDERRAGPIDVEYTDIAAALKLALAAFPEGTGRRVVLISDGNENLGRAAEQARLFQKQGVQVDVLPLAVGYRNTNEVLVQEVEAPPATTPGQRLPVRVLVRNANPTQPVTGTLELVQVRGRDEPRFVRFKGTPADQQPGPVKVTVRPGLNGFEFLDLPTDNAIDRDSFVYRARFTPDNLLGDRVSNNSATAAVLARGQRRVLLLEDPSAIGSHSLLLDTLRAAKFRVDTLPADGLPTAADLGEFLSTYDSVLIGDVPAERFSTPQMEVIRRQAAEQGMGLVMIGGQNSFGLGGYQKTPIEAALPVDCDIRTAQAALKGGLVLVMHGSEMADGNDWQKRMAKLAIERLGPADMIGVLYYGANASWYIPFQSVGIDRSRLFTLIDRMTPGDMPDFDPFLKLAADTLADPIHNLAVKHCVVLSDGDPLYGAVGQTATGKMAKNGITCTTIGVATHGNVEDTRMRNIAGSTKGSFYPVNDPRQLPAIYTRETRQVSRSFLVTDTFTPQLLPGGAGPVAELNAPLPPLHGFVRTTLKPGSRPVMAVEGPPAEDTRFPVVAYWQPGVGRAIAFTSDTREWGRDWAKSPTFARFWPQAIEWSLRSVETGRVSVFPEVRDGRVRMIVDVRDDNEKPLTGVKLKAFVSAPRAGEAAPVVTLPRTGPGRFEGSFAATEAGAYFVNVRVERDGKDIDGRRVGVTVPYSPEFADLEPNPALMRHLAELTGGEVYSEDDAELAKVARAGTVFRPAPSTTKALLPFWASLLIVAGVLLVCDVAVRRIALEPRALWAWGVRRWHHLRTRFDVVPESAGLGQLLRVKEAVAEVIEENRTYRRDEPPPEDDEPPEPPPPPPKPPPADAGGSPKPPEPEAADDYLSRLSKAKRRGRPDENR